MKLNNKMMRNLLIMPLALSLLLSLLSCGDPNINIDTVSYEPKIVVEGYLYPGVPVRNIRITRNFPLNQNVDTASFVITDAIVKINGIQLQFDPATLSYKTDAVTVIMGNTYSFEVNATVAGKAMHTTASTTVPGPAFKLLTKRLGTFAYGDPISLLFIPETATNFYAFSVRPDSASLSNFIFNNNYDSQAKPADIQKNLNEYQYQMSFTENLLPSEKDTIVHPVNDYDTWFYSSYKVIIYAGDQNFKDFVLTAPNVKEFDGNFHEPKLILTGDGIGVFASANRDTAYFTIRR
jgi:hypothetical protein